MQKAFKFHLHEHFRHTAKCPIQKDTQWKLSFKSRKYVVLQHWGVHKGDIPIFKSWWKQYDITDECRSVTKQNLCVRSRSAQKPVGGASRVRPTNLRAGYDPDLTEWKPPQPSVGLHTLLAPHNANMHLNNNCSSFLYAERLWKGKKDKSRKKTGLNRGEDQNMIMWERRRKRALKKMSFARMLLRSV